MGPTGATGEMGATGATGEMGPTGSYDTRTFLSIYNLDEQLVATENNVVFDHNKVVVGSCSHIAGSTDSFFWKPGYYHIFTNLFHIEPCQFSLFLNNNLVSGTVIGSPTGSSQNSLTIIIEITAEDVMVTETSESPTGFAALLQVKNHTSFPLLGVVLNGHSGSGSEVDQINAIFTVFLLSGPIIPL